jgi:hypothetical protein
MKTILTPYKGVLKHSNHQTRNQRIKKP